ncbi:MAG TPA: hypothetical protein PK156_13455 [Polyangium sp.]|nr:hypothetical protein [Polyangium sp.]
MLTSSCLTFLSVVLLAAAMGGCSKEKEEPVVMTLPSATAVAPVKATQDPTPPPAEPVAAAGSAGVAADPAAAATPAAPATDAPKAAAPQPIDGCCSALSSMTSDAKLDAVTKSKATAALAMCKATAPLVKSGKAPRATALTQIKSTMAGKAPSACN